MGRSVIALTDSTGTLGLEVMKHYNISDGEREGDTTLQAHLNVGRLPHNSIFSTHAKRRPFGPDPVHARSPLPACVFFSLESPTSGSHRIQNVPIRGGFLRGLTSLCFAGSGDRTGSRIRRPHGQHFIPRCRQTYVLGGTVPIRLRVRTGHNTSTGTTSSTQTSTYFSMGVVETTILCG